MATYTMFYGFPAQRCIFEEFPDVEAMKLYLDEFSIWGLGLVYPYKWHKRLAAQDEEEECVFAQLHALRGKVWTGAAGGLFTKHPNTGETIPLARHPAFNALSPLAMGRLCAGTGRKPRNHHLSASELGTDRLPYWKTLGLIA